MTSAYDGFVSRHLNRRVSRPVARLLSHTPAKPNQVSLVAVLVSLGAFGAYVAGQPIVGGLLAQAGSIIDGVDGDLARLTGQHSPFGGFLDAVLDRYSDGFILLGLTVWAAGEAGALWVWIAGFAALLGTFSVTYTRARVDESHRTLFDRGLPSLASRDTRLLLVMVGSIAGLGVATVVTLAVLTNAIVAVRLLSAWKTLRQ